MKIFQKTSAGCYPIIGRSHSTLSENWLSLSTVTLFQNKLKKEASNLTFLGVWSVNRSYWKLLEVCETNV